MHLLHGRRALLDLSKTDQYVFHGSPDAGINTFIPRKPKSRAENNGKPIEYADDNIFATDSVDVAIFVAVVFHLGRSGWYTDISTYPVTFTFNVDKDVAQKAKDSVGYVYVFSKEQFEINEATTWEYITKEQVTPMYCVEVNSSDVSPKLDTLKPDQNKHH